MIGTVTDVTERKRAEGTAARAQITSRETRRFRIWPCHLPDRRPSSNASGAGYDNLSQKLALLAMEVSQLNLSRGSSRSGALRISRYISEASPLTCTPVTAAHVQARSRRARSGHITGLCADVSAQHGLEVEFPATWCRRSSTRTSRSASFASRKEGL